MNIYVAHSTGYDYRSGLYAPLRTLSSDKYTFIFPHEGDTMINSKQIIRQSDLILAEVSHPSTGQGIELGWANDSGVPIISIYKTGARISGSLNIVCNTFVEYTDSGDLKQKVEVALSSYR